MTGPWVKTSKHETQDSSKTFQHSNYLKTKIFSIVLVACLQSNKWIKFTFKAFAFTAVVVKAWLQLQIFKH